MLKEKIRESISLEFIDSVNRRDSPNSKRTANHSRKGSENKGTPFLKYNTKEFRNRDHKSGIYTIVKKLGGKIGKSKNSKRVRIFCSFNLLLNL